MVSEQVVEDTWREVATLDPITARKEMEAIARRQRELLVFVTTMCEDLSTRAQEVAIYTLVVILRMFERSSPRPLPRARRRQIAAAFENVDHELGRLTTAHDRFIEQHARVTTGAEPFVMRYLSEVLLEPEDPTAVLADDEVGAIFMYLKTVVDVLHGIPGVRSKVES